MTDATTTGAQRRYIRTEMAVAAAISAAISLFFAWMIFGGRAVVPVLGWDGLIVDAVPQSLMIALMSSLVPTLLTRRRVAAGAVAPLPGHGRAVRHPLLHALAIALPVTVIAVALHAAILPVVVGELAFPAIIAFKCVYGALLGTAVARYAVVAALGETAG